MISTRHRNIDYGQDTDYTSQVCQPDVYDQKQSFANRMVYIVFDNDPRAKPHVNSKVRDGCDKKSCDRRMANQLSCRLIVGVR